MSPGGASDDRALAGEPPYAFLSSLFREHEDLRARIFEDGRRLGRRVYVDEKDFPNRDLENQDDLAVADHLITQIREAEIFICVLGGPRHGSPVKIGSGESAVSFLEIELFQAALLKKPIHLFVIKGFSPQPALASLLNILDFALPKWSIQRYLSEAQVREGICKLLRSTIRTAPTSLIPRRGSALRRLVECLYFARARRNINDAGGGILFLNGRISEGGDVPDEHLIRTTLKAAGEQPNEERRLARLWIALRELMKSGPNGFHDERALEYWNLALGHWASAAAWYGLHGHMYMGCLAALNSMTSIRNRLRAAAKDQSVNVEIAYPGGALASARYSIARLMSDRKAKNRMLTAALRDADSGVTGAADRLGSTLSVRAAIYRALGNITQAVEDYEEVLRRRELAEAGDGPMGVALSNLGHAYLFQGRLWSGRDLIEKGVSLLERNPRAGFLARAKRKLALAYLLTGRPIMAHQQIREAKEIAQEYCAFDQI